MGEKKVYLVVVCKSSVHGLVPFSDTWDVQNSTWVSHLCIIMYKMELSVYDSRHMHAYIVVHIYFLLRGRVATKFGN